MSKFNRDCRRRGGRAESYFNAQAPAWPTSAQRHVGAGADGGLAILSAAADIASATLAPTLAAATLAATLAASALAAIALAAATLTAFAARGATAAVVL